MELPNDQVNKSGLAAEQLWFIGHIVKSKISCVARARGGGGTRLQEPNRDVPLDGVAFSRLE